MRTSVQFVYNIVIAPAVTNIKMRIDMKHIEALVLAVVFATLSTPSFAITQLYDKDKKELAGSLYRTCVANNKQSQSGSGTKDGFIEEHCKCFATNAATELATNKDFVTAYNNKDVVGFEQGVNKVAPSINSACYNATLKKHGGTAINEEQLSKISDKVGITDVEKKGFVNAFVYACVNDGVKETKHSKLKIENYCTCIAETTATKISSRDVAQFGMQRNTKRVDAALQSASTSCAPKLN